MKRPHFSDSLWGVRLQSLWIFFALLYTAVGNITHRRVVSSWMILLAGFLLLAVFAHVIVSDDLERIRRTLLVVLAASLVVVNIAVYSFRDYLAGAFAGIFGLMLGTLVWRSRIDNSFKFLQYSYFVSMSLTVMSAVFGLLATLAIKALLKMGSTGFYIYAPMQTSAMCGFSVGILMGGRILSNKIVGYVSIAPKTIQLLVLQAVVLSLISGIVLALANRVRVDRWIGGLAKSSLFAAWYVICFSLPIALYLRYVHQRSKHRPLCTLQHFLLLVFIAIVASFPANVVLSFATHSDHFVKQGLLSEGITGLGLGLGIATGFYCINRLSYTIMAALPNE